MNTHILNNTIFTIRTKTDVLAVAVGIQKALYQLNNLDTLANVGVFFDTTEMSAFMFRGWATKINRLINDGIGWDGAQIAS